VVAAGPVLEVLTPQILRDVFGVRASTERHADGVIRITYGAQPLAHGRTAETEDDIAADQDGRAAETAAR
jgi:iron complex transport system ATP-binding protein